MTTLKAIIFDLDGTLLDWRGCSVDWFEYERDHLGRVYSYVQNNIHPLKDEDQFCDAMHDAMSDLWMDARKSMIAPHVGELLVETLMEQGVPRDLLDIDACMQAFEHELLEGVILFPEILTELNNLSGYGIRFGLATNSAQPISMRDVELEAVNLLGFFPGNSRLSAADVGFLKPHPRIFEMVLENLGISPDEAIYIGDNPHADIRGAQNAGMKGVLRK